MIALPGLAPLAALLPSPLLAALLLAAPAAAAKPAARPAAKAAPAAAAKAAPGAAAAAAPVKPAVQPVAIEGRKATITASSQLAHADPKRYAPANAVDGDPATAWVEGVPGLGGGQTLTIRFDKPVALDGVVVVAGYAKSAKTFTDNGVPTKLVVALDGKDQGVFPLWFARAAPVDPDKDPGCRPSGDPVNLAPRLIVLKARSKPATQLVVRIAEAEQAGKFDETAISDVLPIVDGAPLKIAGRSLAAAAKVLALLRGRDASKLPGAPITAVEPLSDFPEKAAGLHPETPFGAWLQARNTFDTGATPDAWVAAFAGELLGTSVAAVPTAAGLRLVGPRAFTHGDGEWIELYPTIELDAQGRVTALKRSFYFDGAPGCRGSLPTQ